MTKWSDAERKAVSELLTQHEDLNKKISQHVEEIANVTNASEEQIQRLSDGYSKMLQGGGGSDYLSQLLDIDSDLAHVEFGVTAEFQILADYNGISVDELLVSH